MKKLILVLVVVLFTGLAAFSQRGVTGTLWFNSGKTINFINIYEISISPKNVRCHNRNENGICVNIRNRDPRAVNKDVPRFIPVRELKQFKVYQRDYSQTSGMSFIAGAASITTKDGKRYTTYYDKMYYVKVVTRDRRTREIRFYQGGDYLKEIEFDDKCP